jgi:hypothetical protein
VIAVLASLVRIVLIVVLARLVLRFLAAVVRGYREADAPVVRPQEDMVRDRVCGTFLPRSHALIARVDGREAHFCSAACRDRALRPATT